MLPWPIHPKKNKPACSRAVNTHHLYLLPSFPSSYNTTFSSMATPSTQTSIFETLQRKTFSFPSMPTNQSLPISQTDPQDQGLRRRLSALSLKIQPISFSSPSTSWIRRSKSMSAIGDYAGGSLRKWWDWGWSWILSRRPTFARDLEMNGEEATLLGCHSKGTWSHVFYKVRSEFRRLVRSDHLPPPTRCDPFSYAQNFDDGKRCVS